MKLSYTITIFFKVIIGVVILGVLSILSNLPLTMQFDYVPCENQLMRFGEPGIRIEVTKSACIPAYLWGYLSGVVLGINVFVPAIIQILMNGYIITVVVKQKARKSNGAVIGKFDF